MIKRSMIKKYVFISLALLDILLVEAQNIGKYTFQNKSYYVYPYRISSDDIPALGIKIPDGEYVVFKNYTFQKKFSFKRKKKYVLSDTAQVSAVISVKNNLAEGAASFYNYSRKKRRGFEKKPYSISAGNLKNGLKNGEWKTIETLNNKYEIKNYENGILEGYSYKYNNKKELRQKEKYCGGKECDTVFYYTNGKITKEYDVMEKTVLESERSIYSEAVRSFGEYLPGKVKSYYKKYNYAGELEMDLKFKEGILQPFDSIGSSSSGETKYDYLKYVTVKNPQPGQQIFTIYNRSYYNTHKGQMYFNKGFKYLETSYNARQKFKRKGFLSRKRVPNGQDIRKMESEYLHPDKIDTNSTKPIVILKNINNDDTVETFYIPKYKLVYTSGAGKLTATDDLNRAAYFTEENYNWPENIKRERLIKYVNRKDHYDEKARINPFILKDFIVLNRIDLKNKSTDHSGNIKFGIRSENFEKIIVQNSYSKDNVPLNGQFCFSYGKRSKKWSNDKQLVRYVSYDDDANSGNFTDGKKEGLWTDIDWKKRPNRIPYDFHTDFFAHPKNARTLREQYYKNGLRDGNCIIYANTFGKDDNDYHETDDHIWYGAFGSGELSKKNILYKNFEMEFKNDTLNGSYKEFYPDGSVKTEATFVNGRPDGDYRKYNKQKKMTCLIQFDKGRLNGKYMTLQNDVATCYANFKNNVLIDSLIYYYSDGKPLTCIYVDNERIKSKRTYFPNNKLKEEVIYNTTSQYTLSKETISSESFITNPKRFNNSSVNKASGSFCSYYDNGQKLAEGTINKGTFSGNWKFYSINGQLLHHVTFYDSVVVFRTGDSTKIKGAYTGYYSNGKKRCKGYITNVNLSYDCFTKQDKAEPDFYVVDFFDNNGKQTIKNGSGYYIKYDPNGLRRAAGKLINSLPDSLWRYYTPEQKLDEIGYYTNDEKDGVWYSGDLEGINFEDGACFDMNDPAEVKAYEEKRKDLNITRSIYRNGKRIGYVNFKSNLSKTYKPRSHRGNPSF